MINCKDIYDNPGNYDELLYYPGYLIYRIHKIDSEWNRDNYIGDTTINLYHRLYYNKQWQGHFICYDNGTDLHLYNAMRKYGLDDFSLEIIYTGDYDPELEGQYIELYDSFYHGYNNNLSGKGSAFYGSTKGKIGIVKDRDLKYIKSDEYDYWSSLGWVKGGSMNDRICIHNNEDITKYVYEEELDDYLSNGWLLGNTDSNKQKMRQNLLNYISNSTFEERSNARKIGFQNLRNNKEAYEKWINSLMTSRSEYNRTHPDKLKEFAAKALATRRSDPEKYKEAYRKSVATHARNHGGDAAWNLHTDEVEAKSHAKYLYQDPNNLSEYRIMTRMMAARWLIGWTKLREATKEDYELLPKIEHIRFDENIQHKFSDENGNIQLKKRYYRCINNHPNWTYLGVFTEEDKNSDWYITMINKKPRWKYKLYDFLTPSGKIEVRPQINRVLNAFPDWKLLGPHDSSIDQDDKVNNPND